MAESIDTRHENWHRVVWGLLYVREGLQGYVDAKGKQQYQTFMNNVNAKCNNQICDQCQINSKCINGRTKVTGKSPFRPGHFCDEMNKEVQSNHGRNNPLWTNTDSTKWLDQHVGYWEVAKCYLSSAGYLDKTGPNQVDASGLLSICINSSFIKQHISNIQRFEEVRSIRNKTLHDARYELEGKTADDYLDKMISVLEDPQELMHDAFAKQAAYHIRKIKARTERTPAILTDALQNRLHTDFDVDKFPKELEDLMYNKLSEELKEFIVEEVKHELKHCSDDRDNGEREQKVEELRQRLVKYYQKQLNNTPISPLLSDKDEKLDKFYVPPKIVEKNPRKVGDVKEENGTPVTSYRQMFCKGGELTHHVFIIGEAGMGKSSCAAMCALKWANQFSSTKTSNDTDINASHQTPFQRLRSEWEHRIQLNNRNAHTYHPEKEQDAQFQDDTFYKEIEFLFHLKLRESCELCDLTEMIQNQLISRIYQKDVRNDAYSTMQHVLSNHKCMIIADGLDEWAHPDSMNCNCTEEDKVIPYLMPTIDAVMLITSRPSRISQQRIKHTKIDKYLEIEGAADIKLLNQKILNTLNETVTEKKTLQDFGIFVERMRLTRLLLVPLMSMLLVCLWFEGMHKISSLCDIYAYTIEMMLGRRALSPGTVSEKDIIFPKCFEHTKYVKEFYSIVMEMAKLAFTTLFLDKKKLSLVFDKVDCLAHNTRLCLLESGILQETKAASLIRKSSNYSFIHKTVQEYLAAIYVSYHPKEIHTLLAPFNEKNGDMSDVSQVFIFMCGLNIELANEMSAMISKRTVFDRTFHTDLKVRHTLRQIVSGYKEAQANQVSNIQLSLCIYDYSYTTDTEILNDLLSINKYRVSNISTRSSGTSHAKLQEVFCSSTDTLTNVCIHGLAGQYDLSACNRLQYLTIGGSETTDIVVNISSLVSLVLQCVSKTVEYSILQLFPNESNILEKLCIENSNNTSSICKILPQLTHLRYLEITRTDFGDFVLSIPDAVTEVRMITVTITARLLLELVRWQESSKHTVVCSLSECTIEPKMEYDDIIRYMQTKNFKDDFNSYFTGKTLVFERNIWPNAEENKGPKCTNVVINAETEKPSKSLTNAEKNKGPKCSNVVINAETEKPSKTWTNAEENKGPKCTNVAKMEKRSKFRNLKCIVL